MHRLRTLAAEVRGAAMIVRPFIADHDRRIAIFHLAVREIAVGLEPHEGGLEPEIGGATCRERVCQYGSIVVVAVSFKKKIVEITKQHIQNNKITRTHDG